MPPYNATDPTATFLSSSCLDLLLIELVPMAYRVTNELDAASASDPNLPPSAAQQQQQHQHAAASSSDSVSASAAGTAGTASAPPGGGAAAGGRRVMDEEEERDAVFYRLEMLGYRVGQGLVERYVYTPVCCVAPSAVTRVYPPPLPRACVRMRVHTGDPARRKLALQNTNRAWRREGGGQREKERDSRLVHDD